MSVQRDRELEWVEDGGDEGTRSVVCQACADVMVVQKFIDFPPRVLWSCRHCGSWCSVLVRTGKVWGSAFTR